MFLHKSTTTLQRQPTLCKKLEIYAHIRTPKRSLVHNIGIHHCALTPSHSCLPTQFAGHVRATGDDPSHLTANIVNAQGASAWPIVAYTAQACRTHKGSVVVYVYVLVRAFCSHFRSLEHLGRQYCNFPINCAILQYLYFLGSKSVNVTKSGDALFFAVCFVLYSPVFIGICPLPPGQASLLLRARLFSTLVFDAIFFGKLRSTFVIFVQRIFSCLCSFLLCMRLHLPPPLSKKNTPFLRNSPFLLGTCQTFLCVSNPFFCCITETLFVSPHILDTACCTVFLTILLGLHPTW